MANETVDVPVERINEKIKMMKFKLETKGFIVDAKIRDLDNQQRQFEKEKQAKLQAAQDELKKVLNTQQEAVALSLSLVN